MKVLFITHKYPPSIGGMEKQSFELIQRTDMPKVLLAYQGNESIISFFFLLKKRVQKILVDHPDIGVIHLNDGLMAAAFTLLCSKTSIKKIVTFHGLDIVFPLAVYQKYILPKVAKYMDCMICVSHATRDACKIRNIDTDKLIVIPNGVDTTIGAHDIDEEAKHSIYKKYGINPEDKIIISVGRPVRRKGFVWFAQHVLPTLPENYKYFHIGNVQRNKTIIPLPSRMKKKWQLFMGATSDADALIDLSSQKQYQDRLILTGKINDLERDMILSIAHVVIMPNIMDEGDMEGFGLVALEAAVCGKSVLVSAIEGITDAIHDDKNGHYIPSGDPIRWREAVIKYCNEDSFYNEKVRSYTIGNFSWDTMVERYKRVFLHHTLQTGSKDR
jgi:phosphatidylinositol alpha-1,6-mannosyltransferase